MSSVNPDKLPPNIEEMRDETLSTAELKAEEDRVLSLIFLYFWISCRALVAIFVVLVVLAFVIGLELQLISLAFEWGRKLGGG